MSIDRRIKIKIKMLEAGIIPAFNAREFKSMIASLSIEEKRIAKRKFRKLWRKLSKNSPDTRDLLADSENINPTDEQLINRPNFVILELAKTIKD